MERREFIALLGMATAMMPPAALAEPVHGAVAQVGPLAGTWMFSSSVNTRKDGSTFDRWGDNPKGIFMFDRGGHYAQIIVGGESRVFGAKVFCAFGNYTLDDAAKTLITHIESSSASKFNGVTQTRTILLLTETELKYTNPITATGTTAEVLWKRVT
jgi:hypothetical protein